MNIKFLSYIYVNMYNVATGALNNFKKTLYIHVLTDAYFLVLVDTDQNIFVSFCSRPTFTIYIFEHRKYPEARLTLTLAISTSEYLNSVFRNVRRDIFGLYKFIMYICWYISYCLLYVYSFSLISNMSIVLL